MLYIKLLYTYPLPIISSSIHLACYTLANRAGLSENMATPYVVPVITELTYTGMYVVSKAALDQGMNAFVFSFYRQAAASLLLVPIALVFQRKTVSSLSPGLLLKMFFCALIGVSIHILGRIFENFACVASRMEVLKPRSCSGIAKLAGVGLCLTGVFIIAFYAGPELSPVDGHHAFGHTSAATNSPNRLTWIKGTFLMVLASVSWSVWMVMQARLLNEYPHKLLATVMQSVFAVVQLFIIALVAERDFSEWKLRLDVSLLAILYNGFVVSGISYYLQVWCVEMKGPVFLAIWTPLSFVFTIFCSSFFLGEIVHLGSIIGGVLLVGGLYSVLWGKSKEPTVTSSRVEASASDNIQDEQGRRHKSQEEEVTSAFEAEQT
ncbi:hypothetical protein EJB05_28487, partial [Eragrostis curvula]